MRSDRLSGTHQGQTKNDMEQQKDNEKRQNNGIGQPAMRQPAPSVNNGRPFDNEHKSQRDQSGMNHGYGYVMRKAEKLTTALYMVTDIMSEKEPMKWKAREAGVELLSDMMVMQSSGGSERMTILRNATKKIEQIVSFLDVAQSTRMISEMNASVLKKEYVALKDACLTEWQQTSDGS